MPLANENRTSPEFSRRSLLYGGSLFLAASATPRCLANAAEVILRVGLITDLHHADKPLAGTRHYRESMGKLETAEKEFKRQRIDLLVEMGDLIDAADTVAEELKYLKSIDGKFSQIHQDRHYVLGNHCVDTLHKEEFLGQVGQEKSYYSFDRKGYHFIVLDACFLSDGEPYGRKNFTWTDCHISAEELQWLEADLAATETPTIVFAHQRLDIADDHGVRNQKAVRALLEASGRVKAVFQGHSHANDLKEIGGIFYCTLHAMVEGSGDQNNGFSVLNIHSDGALRLDGFVKQADYRWMQK